MINDNNRIHCFGRYVPLYDVECVDEKQQIWRGKRIVEINTPENAMLTIYFSRFYDRKNNDMDRVCQEYEIHDDKLMGEKFVLVPKEKILFGIDEGSAIIKRPPIKLKKNNSILNNDL